MSVLTNLKITLQTLEAQIDEVRDFRNMAVTAVRERYEAYALNNGLLEEGNKYRELVMYDLNVFRQAELKTDPVEYLNRFEYVFPGVGHPYFLSHTTVPGLYIAKAVTPNSVEWFGDPVVKLRSQLYRHARLPDPWRNMVAEMDALLGKKLIIKTERRSRFEALKLFSQSVLEAMHQFSAETMDGTVQEILVNVLKDTKADRSENEIFNAYETGIKNYGNYLESVNDNIPEREKMVREIENYYK